ncbi:MAG: phosphoribosylamine--glycine ligase [Rhodothermales bacterium]
MRILIIGSGGREHALTWALARSPHASELYIAPGNPGTALLGHNVDISVGDIDTLLRFAQEHQIDLTVVGPEQPLVDGIVDAFQAEGLAIVGPTAAAAQLEGSKAFSKAFMAKYGIPTAAYATFSADQHDEALAYIAEQGAPIVVKASGLAAGKGAVVCMTLDEAQTTANDMLRGDAFGTAGEHVVIEAFMEGEEASLFALCDGTDYVLLAPAQDHKRVGEGDTGLNTGGMGAYAPAPVMTPDLIAEACRTVVEPTLAGMCAEGTPYTGILYVGLMMTTEGPKVVEYNCRLGDPETQVVLPLLEDDLVEIFAKLTQGQLGDMILTPTTGAAACVVMASGGYPGSYEKGKAITGDVDSVSDAVMVFQAGTKRHDGHLVTAGGRVLAVSAVGDDIEAALARAYDRLGEIHFDDAQYRRDIGWRAIERLRATR